MLHPCQKPGYQPPPSRILLFIVCYVIGFLANTVIRFLAPNSGLTDVVTFGIVAVGIFLLIDYAKHHDDGLNK